MKFTVIELKAMLHGLPDNLPVQFQPITSAYLGANHPLRVSDTHVYKDLEHAMPGEKGAELTIYISEDRSDDHSA